MFCCFQPHPHHPPTPSPRQHPALSVRLRILATFANMLFLIAYALVEAYQQGSQTLNHKNSPLPTVQRIRLNRNSIDNFRERIQDRRSPESLEYTPAIRRH